jgi:hypothetical protein
MRDSTSGLLVALLVLGLALLGCATNDGLRTLQGQSGPVAWEASDIRQTSEDSGHRLRWDYVLTLRNTSSTAITFEKVVRNVITPSGDVFGGMASEALTRRLDVGAEWRTVNNSYSHGCPQCDVNRAAEMLRKGITRILEFTGHDDQGQPVTVTVRIPLNSSVGARTDMAKAATASADVVPPDAWTSVPIWKVGDQWTYRWESPRGSGTRVYEVTSEAIVKGIDCYVVKYSRSEDYQRKADLAFVRGNNRGALDYTYTPPRAWATWPLYVGRAWELSIVEERPQDRTTENIFKTWRVEGKERITVPAGTFDTYKIIERNKRDNSLSTEHWLAPEVKARVRLNLYFSYGVEKRELIAYKVD